MENVLLCWLGDADLRGAGVELPPRPRLRQRRGAGPIANAIEAATYDRIVLLNNRGKKCERDYRKWLKSRTSAKIEIREMSLSDVTDHGEIYGAVTGICEDEAKIGSTVTYHLSPGTPAMASVWMLLAKTRFPGRMIRSSPERGVELANVPFDISAELLPLLETASSELQRQGLERPPEAAAFADIIGQSAEMGEVISMAQRVAVWPVPVLLEGESGTGKELFARAIHHASPRAGKGFVAVNCGAIPSELVEAELFGHEKGAFTSAGKAKAGYFEQANGGTLFLDELGELPLDAQVKLLRALENGEVRRVGAEKTIKVDVRVVAATNRSLVDEMASGGFREDLFYRLAIARIPLPPLRKRQGDITPLLDFALGKVNEEGRTNVPGYEQKKLSAGAKNLLLQHRWPGNVREVLGTIRRAAIWTEGPKIEKKDAERALLRADQAGRDGILDRSLDGGIDLPELLASVARHYIGRALAESGGVKTKAAKLLGLSSYQTLTNWMDKYNVEP